MIKIFIFVAIILFIIYFNLYIQPHASRDSVVMNKPQVIDKETFVPLSSYLPSSQKEINLKSLNYPDNLCRYLNNYSRQYRDHHILNLVLRCLE